MLDLTMASTGALVFGIINIGGNFGTVFTDQAYW
jgi:urea-proton symporter